MLRRPFSCARALMSLTLSVYFLGVLGCGDDDASGNASDGAGATGGASSTIGAGGGTGASGGAGGAGVGGAEVEQLALLRGTLAANDLAEAKAKHDAIAQGGEEAAAALGDVGHEPLLGTTLLGTVEGEFTSIDRWETDRMDELYGDPNFQAALGEARRTQ